MNFIPFVVAVALMVLSGTYLVLRATRADRHGACLRSIARLERELFPEWFKDEKLDPFGWFEPGAVIQFEPGAKVYYLPGPLQQLEAQNLPIQQELLFYGEKRT